jgi:hypothetical protein
MRRRWGRIPAPPSLPGPYTPRHAQRRLRVPKTFPRINLRPFWVCAKGVDVMSDSTTPTDPNALLFPAFMYGDKTTCRRKMKAEAKKWAKHYSEGREFPVPKLMPIPPGSVVFTDETFANFVGGGYSMNAASTIVTISANPKEQGLHIQWRAYLLDDLRFDAGSAAKCSQVEGLAFRRVFVPFVCKYAWGAISAAAIGTLLNSIELTVPRIEGVLRFWEALDTLKYVDFGERPVSLAGFMTNQFQGTITMWVDQPRGNMRADLHTAIDHMRQASEDEIHMRLVKRLREYVDTDKYLKNREWLKSPGVIEAGLETERQLGQNQYDNLTSGRMSAHGGFLVWLERNYGPAAV